MGLKQSESLLAEIQFIRIAKEATGGLLYKCLWDYLTTASAKCRNFIEHLDSCNYVTKDKCVSIMYNTGAEEITILVGLSKHFHLKYLVVNNKCLFLK